MPVGFQIPGQAYDPNTGELLNPDEQDAYARLQQDQANGFRYGPVGPQGPVDFQPSPHSTGNPDLDAQLARQASGFGDRNVPTYTAGESLGFLGQAASNLGELATSSYAGPLGLPDNAVTQELTRPVNYVPFGKGVSVARAATEAVGGRLAQEAAKPLVDMLPESVRPVADLGVNLAGQVATGGLYGRAGGALGMGIKDVSRNGDEVVKAASEPADAVRKIADTIVPGEKPSIGLLRQYEGRVNTQGLNIRRELDEGNRILKSLDIGKPTGTSRVVERTPDVEELYKALHGEGPVPPKFAGVFDRLKASVDAETQAAIDFDPKFMAHPDYFPRGWKQVEIGTDSVLGRQNPGSGAMGATPGFSKPRTDATFTEILNNVYDGVKPDGTPYQYRLEPASWNPFEQLALRKVAGSEYREQTALIDKLKLSGTAVPVDGPIPNGYRIPQVGPAFEGKPKVAPSEDGGQQFFGFTSRYAVPDNVADVLENMYGRKPNLGNAIEGVLNVGQSAKRVKLLGSLFQQVDFTTRTGVYTFGGAVDDLLAGKPISAVAKIVKLPRDLGEIVAANLSPKRRELLRDDILSGKPLFTDRPGISLKGIAESGWNQQDITIVRRDLRSAIKEAVDGESLTEAAKRNLQRLEAANSRGLFDGVYPQAQIISLKNWVLPNLLRQHPDWTDEQIMGSAANEINKAFSTLGDYQTWFKNPYVQHLTRSLIFSTNEPEALLRGAGSTFVGNNKRLWQTAYAGGFLFLATVANLVHAASTTILDGKPEFLPLDRYNPVKADDTVPGGYSYNSRFLSPDTPLSNGGRRLALDLMGQMDTALRVLDPVGFIGGRANVVPRAIYNQIQGEDYFGNRIDQIGPKGIVSRGAQLATDLFEPISAGQVRNATGATIGEGEPVGTAGSLVQAAGVNLRAEPFADTVKRDSYQSLSPDQQVKALPAKTWGDLQSSALPGDFSDEVSKYKNHFEWQKATLDQYRKLHIDSGQRPELATALAEADLQKNPLEQLYSQVRNVHEREWVIANPELAIKVMGEDAKKPKNERRLSLTLAELQFLMLQPKN